MTHSTRVRLFLCGDVMTGRGIDQILPHPVNPRLHEPCVDSARAYVALAEHRNGPVDAPVACDYVWGDALAVFDEYNPTLRIINLETAITRRGRPWAGKSIHYRMHPANLSALDVLAPDCCSLANNHTLDWGREGFAETLDVLDRAGIATAGAGRSSVEAWRPARLPISRDDAGQGCVLVFACATGDSGVPEEWAATRARAGIARLPELSEHEAARLLERIGQARQPGDIVVVSMHWGPNWGYAVPPEQRRFARQLVENGVDLVHGHSSHHPKSFELHAGRLILYGCGDFLNDYEGIGGHEAYRPELGVMYFASIEAGNGQVHELRLVPTRVRRLRIERAAAQDARWLQAMLGPDVAASGGRLECNDGVLVVRTRDDESTGGGRRR